MNLYRYPLPRTLAGPSEDTRQPLSPPTPDRDSVEKENYLNNPVHHCLLPGTGVGVDANCQAGEFVYSDFPSPSIQLISAQIRRRKLENLNHFY